MNVIETTVSVVIPVYNCIEFLEETINSIFNQPKKVIEIILIDDGSQDGSGALCDEIAASFSNVRVFHQANAGVSVARNVGIANAIGTYINFCDSDDAWVENCYNDELLAILQKGYDVIGGGFYTSNDKMTSLKWMGKDENFENILKGGTDSIWAHGNRHTGCMFFRTEFLREKEILFPPKLKYNEDQIFKVYAECLCNEMFFCELPIYVYRVHSGSSVHHLDPILVRYQCWMDYWYQADKWLMTRHGIKTDYGAKFAEAYFLEMLVVYTETLAPLGKLPENVMKHIKSQEFAILTKENCPPHLKNDFHLFFHCRPMFYCKHRVIGFLRKCKNVLKGR